MLVHEKVIHLAKLADLQTAAHGVPEYGDHRPPLQLSARDDAMQAFAQFMFAARFDPRYTRLRHEAAVPVRRQPEVGATQVGDTDLQHANEEAAGDGSALHPAMAI